MNTEKRWRAPTRTLQRYRRMSAFSPSAWSAAPKIVAISVDTVVWQALKKNVRNYANRLDPFLELICPTGDRNVGSLVPLKGHVGLISRSFDHDRRPTWPSSLRKDLLATTTAAAHFRRRHCRDRRTG